MRVAALALMYGNDLNISASEARAKERGYILGKAGEGET